MLNSKKWEIDCYYVRQKEMRGLAHNGTRCCASHDQCAKHLASAIYFKYKVLQKQLMVNFTSSKTQAVIFTESDFIQGSQFFLFVANTYQLQMS